MAVDNILNKLIDWISFSIDATGEEPEAINLCEEHWDAFRKALIPLGVKVSKYDRSGTWMGVPIKPKRGDKPMIKSFHHKSPTAVHTYLALEETKDGVLVRAISDNGDHVKNGQVCLIGPRGITLSSGVNLYLNIQVDDNGNPVVRDHRGRVLMSVDEYKLRYGEGNYLKGV